MKTTPHASTAVTAGDQHHDLPFMVLAGLVVFGLLWLVRKNVELPHEVVLSVGALGLLFLLFFMVRQPELPLYALVAYLPFSRELVGNVGAELVGLNLTNVLIILISVGWFMRAVATRQPLFRPSALNVLITLFVLFGLVSVYRGSQNWSASSLDMDVLIQMKRWFTPMWLFFIGANIVNDRTAIRRLIAIISIIVVLMAVMAAWDYESVRDLSNIDKARIGGVLGQPNSLGAFFSYYMFLMAGLLLTYPKRLSSWLLLIPLVLCFRGIMVTFSRGAYLAFAAGVLALCFFRSKRLFLVVLILAGVIALNPVLLPTGVRYRFAQTVDTRHHPDAESIEDTLESSSRGRLVIWRGAVEMIKDHPFFGVGFGMFQYLIAAYVQLNEFRDAHNTYLLVAAEMGLPAACVFILILLLALYNAGWLATRAKDPLVRALGIGVAAGTAALIVSNLFGSRMNSEDLISYFWLLAGAVVAARTLMKRGELE